MVHGQLPWSMKNYPSWDDEKPKPPLQVKLHESLRCDINCWWNYTFPHKVRMCGNQGQNNPKYLYWELRFLRNPKCSKCQLVDQNIYVHGTFFKSMKRFNFKLQCGEKTLIGYKLWLFEECYDLFKFWKFNLENFRTPTYEKIRYVSFWCSSCGGS